LGEFDDYNFDGQQVICVVTTIFNHDSGAEAALSELRYANRDLVTSNVYDHAGNTCLELFVLKGMIDDISSYVSRLRPADGVTTVEHSILTAEQSVLA